MKILSFTCLFPNATFPVCGVFVRERLRVMAKQCELRVVAPVPYFPPLKIHPIYYSYSQVPRFETQGDLSVVHPRFLTFPGWGNSLDGWLLGRSTLPTIRRIQREFDFDWIDAHWAYPDGYGAVCLGKILNKPVSITIRGDDIHIFPQLPWRREKILNAMKRATCVISVSDELKRASVALGADAEKIHVVPNGVDTVAFREVDQHQCRESLGLPHDRRIILSVGRIHPGKGLHFAIEAIAQLVSDGLDDLYYVIVGGVDSEAGSYDQQLRDVINRHGLEDHVRFAGIQRHEVLYRWYCAADCFCLPSIQEGWPNVIIESLACGRPVVAARVGGVPEIIKSPNHGVLFDELTPEAISSAVRVALERQWNPDDMKRYASSQSWENVATRVLDLFASYDRGPT